MSKDRDPDTPPDVALLLRTYSEQRWLSREVIPVVRQIETRERLREEQLPAAAAYLEVTWAEAVRLAGEADAALRRLDALGAIEEEGSASPACGHPLGRQPLPAKARRYQASVRALREAVARRVTELAERGMRAEGECLPASVATPVGYADSADRRADTLA